MAVFCDGWAYHKDSLREDAAKRSAIVASGAFWVWSVAHQDVAAALAGSLDTDLESPLVTLARHDGANSPATVPRAQEKAFTQHAVARLVQWLASKEEGASEDPAVTAMQRNAAWLEFLMIPATGEDKAECDQQRAAWLPRLPLYIREPGGGYAHVMSKPNGLATVVGWWPLVLAKGLPLASDWNAPGAVVLEDAPGEDAEALHRDWRRWLQIYNTAQFLPGVLMATTAGLDAHDYEVLGQMGAQRPAPAQPGAQAGLNAAWQQVLGQTFNELIPGLKRLAIAGAMPPEVGMELADEKGRVMADAELTWIDQNLALLRPDQADLVEVWTSAGWKTALLDDALATIQGVPWEKRTADMLGLQLNNEEI